MNPPPSLAGRHVAILGAGRSGRAAARLALREGARVSVWDAAGTEAFAGMPEEVELHPGCMQPAQDFKADLLVVSPGIDTYGPTVAAFARAAGEVIGEVELASRFYQGRIVGITGTNGKTTTTGLVACMLQRAGLGGVPCGNFGLPFAEVVLEPVHPAAVSLELSSFQLETIRHLHPDVAVWLNFAPDHMDRYPTVDAYRKAKLRIFENVGAGDLVVARCGEGLPDLPAPTVTFSTEDPSADWFCAGAQIRHAGRVVIDMERDTHLRGLHNAENLMAAMAACRHLGVEPEVMLDALRDYRAPRHRCELVRVLDGVEYLNDSKATNLHALVSALRSQTRPVVLLAGGKDKGLDYSEALPLLREKVLMAVTYGQIAEPLAGLFSQAVPCEAVTGLEEAVVKARRHAPQGSVVLLSPGTSSFDQFSGYEQRGDRFRDLVNTL